MPSLFRYFVVVGGALTGLLLLVNHWLGPVAAPAQAIAAAPEIVVRHDPRASIIERLRVEAAARRAAERGETLPAPAQVPAQVAAGPEPIVPVTDPSPTKPEPPQTASPVALVTAPGAPDAEAQRAAQFRAAQIQAAQVRAARIARERARGKRLEEAASRQQDQFFYGARQPAYAAAPSTGPFGGNPTW